MSTLTEMKELLDLGTKMGQLEKERSDRARAEHQYLLELEEKKRTVRHI